VLLAVARSPFGSVLAAIRDHEHRTRFLGFDVRLVKTAAFALSAAVAGLAGALFTAQFGFVSPPLVGFALSTEVLIWTAVGGRDVLFAAFLGAILVRSVESRLSEALGQYWLMALGFLFVVSVVFAPRGLFGRALALPLPARLRLNRNVSAADEDAASIA
jgi:urea transport system permease protein